MSAKHVCVRATRFVVTYSGTRPASTVAPPVARTVAATDVSKAALRDVTDVNARPAYVTKTRSAVTWHGIMLAWKPVLTADRRVTPETWRPDVNHLPPRVVTDVRAKAVCVPPTLFAVIRSGMRCVSAFA